MSNTLNLHDVASSVKVMEKATFGSLFHRSCAFLGVCGAFGCRERSSVTKKKAVCICPLNRRR